MPARISVPVIMGQDSAIQAFSGMSSMAGYEGETPLMATRIYENLLRLVAHVQKEELFGKEDLSLTKDTDKISGNHKGSWRRKRLKRDVYRSRNGKPGYQQSCGFFWND